ncbi:MAG: hydrogen peroxide-dependent heme synthase [Acidobacteriota bacterium]
MTEFPPVPLTVEGSCVLHQMFRFDWKAWRGVSPPERGRIAVEATKIFRELEQGTPHRDAGQSALYSLLGHKGDLMMIHFRNSVSALNQVELSLAQSEFHTFLKASSSYLSVVELGLYESSMKTFAALHAEGMEPHTPPWNTAINDVLQRQRDAMAMRLRPAIPPAKYLCFYPMDRKRGEQINWYTVPMAERQRMMHDHGMIGRRYGDRVRQIISGSIGLDDWEWGVDLFADDPVTFKQLIYEMRFDEASALYAVFGPFYVGVRLPPDKLEGWLMGKLEEAN